MKNTNIFLMISLLAILLCVIICVFLVHRNQTMLWRNFSFYVTEETTEAKNPAVVNGRININVASAEELSYLEGIGTTLAIRIVQYRIDNGLFKSTKELMNVDGMTESTYNAIIEYITIG